MSRTRGFLALAASITALLALPGLARAAIVTNGDFETGSLSGWQQTNSGAGSWTAYTGTLVDGEFPVFAPPQGSFAAITRQSDPSFQYLYQDLALPPQGSVDQLGLTYYYTAYAPILSPDNLRIDSPNEQYRIDVMRPGAPIDSVSSSDILLTVFRTLTGDPETVPPTQRTVDLSAFAGQTVRLRLAVAVTEDEMNAGADAISVRSNGFTIGETAYNKKKGTATVPVTLPDAGNLAATGKGVKVKVGASTAKAVSGGTVKLKVKPKGKTKSKLNDTGKAKVKLKVTYTPNGLTPATQKTKLKLKKKS